MNEKMTKTELTFDQLESEMGPPVSSRTQVGIPLYSIIITRWNEYQSEYLRQKPYREGHRGDDKQSDDLGPKPVTRVTSRVEESRGEERSSTGEAHFNIKFEFIKRLRIIEEELEQETDNSRNERLFDFILNHYRALDPIRELDSIRELFKKNPNEVHSRIKTGKSLTDQLYALFDTAAKYAGLKE